MHGLWQRMFHRRAWLSCLLSLSCLVVADELSTSPRLESDMCLERGCMALVQMRDADGWWGNVRDTSYVLIALDMVGFEGNLEPLRPVYENARKRIRTELEAGTFRTTPDLAAAIRALSRAPHERAFLRKQGALLAKMDFSTCSPLELLEIADALFLTDSWRIDNAGERLLQALAKADGVPALACNAMKGIQNLPVIPPAQIPPETWVWYARARLCVPKSDETRWRDPLVVHLLESQAQDGAWGTHDRLRATASAIAAIVHARQ
ncbi:MAG: hypothetical protein IJJ26_07690 [Victivallales bacterium]|nr:hypothetical protein [Victivallales bacterium]